VTALDGADAPDPPICTLATAGCFSLAVRVNARVRAVHTAWRPLIVIGGSQELRGMYRPGVGLWRWCLTVFGALARDRACCL
jgi:hypothetical protein